MCTKCIGLEDQIARYLGFARGVDALTRGRIYDLVLHLQNDKEAIVHAQDALRRGFLCSSPCLHASR